MAVWLAQRNTPDALHIYALDFATRGLQPLAALPHSGTVVSGDDIERVQRLIVTIEREIARRKSQFAAVGASTLTEYQRLAAGATLPRIIVLLDGYGGFTSTFDKVDFGEWIERVGRLVGDGRPLGIHWVITADRRAAVGLTLLTTVGSRVILRMADDDEYSSLGLNARLAKGTALPPGRGFVGATVEVQVAVIGNEVSGDGQAASVEAVGQSLAARFPDANVPRIASLPLEISVSDLIDPGGYQVAVGIGQSTLATVSIGLRDGNLLIAGPNRSGRSTALLSMARSLRRSTPGAELYAFLPRRSPLSIADFWQGCARGATEADELAAELFDLLGERDGSESPIVIFIDDGSELADSPADRALEKIVRGGRDAAIHVIGAAESASALRCYAGWLPEIRKDRRGLILNPDPDIDGDLVGVRLPRRTGGGMPPGRGYLVLDGVVELVQSAS